MDECNKMLLYVDLDDLEISSYVCLLCRTSFPTFTLYILALSEKCTDGALRILSLVCSHHLFHAKSRSMTAPSISPSPTLHPCFTVRVQLGRHSYQVTILSLRTQVFTGFKILTLNVEYLLIWSFEDESHLVLVDSFDYCNVLYLLLKTKEMIKSINQETLQEILIFWIEWLHPCFCFWVR